MDIKREQTFPKPPPPDTPPPAYTDGIDINAAFATLNLSGEPRDPIADTCLAHLKLLAAFHALREEVGYTDGLWGICDDPACHEVAAAAAPGARGPAAELLLSKSREKRWAVFVARAADSYEAWWAAAMQSAEPLAEEHMREPLSARYEGFPSAAVQAARRWSALELPPLDVLMVWHAHMLNPRAFLEDMMRCGARDYWAAGMPWDLVSAAINPDFGYSVSDDAKARWTSLTGRQWNNVNDSMIKELPCPACSESAQVKWSTCGFSEDGKPRHITDAAQLIGSGYGDGQFSHTCHGCGITINKELLSAAKFVRDTKALLAKSRPLPGTILDPVTGGPKLEPATADAPRTYPNRLVKKGARADILDLIRPGGAGDGTPPTMDDVRAALERTMADPARHQEATGQRRAPWASRPFVRRAMRAYWHNFSPFALDLVGAVTRQSIFTAKMAQLDWLRSPAARGTMERLVKKYGRFFAIMAQFPDRVAVPTLDVDLAWHTHQLSPSAYYAYSVRTTKKFVDHDDKIDESKLSTAFSWTSSIYQWKYNEVYSECTCWYCESVRTSHVSGVGKLLGISKNDQISEKFHTSGRAKLCPPDNSAHISAHNAVRTVAADERGRRLLEHARARHDRMLETSYAKAKKRAEQKGRKLPPQQEYYAHWGYAYFMYSPYVYPVYYSPEVYCGWDHSTVHTGQGEYGNCCQGSCGTTTGGGCATAGSACGSDIGSGGFDGGGVGGGGGMITSHQQMQLRPFSRTHQADHDSRCLGGGCSSSSAACGGGGGGCGGGSSS
ncbi:hypothetical protein RB594_006972 [Gaeumannomyces avenae]